MPSMLLYSNPISGNCYKVRLLAAQLGIALELENLDVVDRSNRLEVLGRLNPALRVPTLVLDGGHSLGESNAILNYLAEGSEYLPSDPFEHAQMLAWQFFEQYEIEPNIAVLRFWALTGIQTSDDLKLAKRDGGRRALEALERGLQGRDWLVAGRYTIADISLYGYTHVAADAGFDLRAFPAIGAWIARVAAQPGYVPIDA
jgi:glutathione S-transferase